MAALPAPPLRRLPPSWSHQRAVGPSSDRIVCKSSLKYGAPNVRRLKAIRNCRIAGKGLEPTNAARNAGERTIKANDVDERGGSALLLPSALGGDRPLLAFPGGGMFFYWQIGAVSALSRHYDLLQTDLSGASAGALAATLSACGVDGRKAAEAAFNLSLQNNLWDRPTGLGGIWSTLIRQWLHDLLPDDAVSRCTDRLHIHVLDLPSIRRRSPFFSRRVVNDFESKDDLVECCMASVHIPLFMDGRVWTWYRNHRSVDGSILASRERMSLGTHRPTVWLDYAEDEEMKKQRLRFLSLGKGPDATWQWIEEMMGRGEAFADLMEARGALQGLRPLVLPGEGET